MKLLLLLAMAVAASAPALAWAQERPATKPTRDVDVVYSANVGGKVVEQRTRLTAGGREVRIDTPSPGLYLVINRDTRTMDMVSDGDHGVLQMPYDPSRAVGMAAENQTFQRVGIDKVAGLACTEWLTTDTTGKSVTACFTDDGVMLRARAGTAVLVQAARVAYGPLDPAIFAIPAGYRRATPPEQR